MWSVATEFIKILAESGVYLLFGFLLAGMLHSLTSRSDILARTLTGGGLRPIFLAALIGAPLPLCSCAVIPAAMALRRKGASKGTTASFMISSPETDVVSVVLTWALIGPVMAVFRVVSAVITAVLTGVIVNVVDRVTARFDQVADTPQTATDPCGAAQGHAANTAGAPSADAHDHADDYDPRHGFWWNALRFGFVSFFDDLIGSLLFGLIVGAVISSLLPELGLQRYAAGSWWSYLAMLAIGIPMYVCASASVPIAVGLMTGGISPGAALVFLLTGPATNAASIVVLVRYFGRWTLIAYLVSIAAISIAMGLWLDAYWGSAAMKSLSPAALAAAPTFVPGALEIAGAAAFAILALWSIRRTHLIDKNIAAVARRLGVTLNPAVAKSALALLCIAAYILSGFFTVDPGQRGVITRFGRITHAHLGPGLYYAWPWPLGRADIVSTAALRRLEIGFRTAAEVTTMGGAGILPATAASIGFSPSSPPAAGPDAAGLDPLQDESWLVTGSEDIISIKWVVHYRVIDTEKAVLSYLYGSADTERTLRAAAEYAIRVAVGRRDIDTLYTVDRAAVEAVVRDQILQPALDAAALGIHVEDVNLVEVHSPPEVHPAFRDVASAAEDRVRATHVAYEYAERTINGARGEAAQMLAAATGKSAERINHAAGESTKFEQRRLAAASDPLVTRVRLYLETVDSVWPDFKKLIDLTAPFDPANPDAPSAGPAFDLWLVPEGVPVPPPVVNPNIGREGQ